MQYWSYQLTARDWFLKLGAFWMICFIANADCRFLQLEQPSSAVVDYIGSR